MQTGNFLLAGTEAVEDMTLVLCPLHAVVPVNDGLVRRNHRQNLGEHIHCSEKETHSKGFCL